MFSTLELEPKLFYYHSEGAASIDWVAADTAFSRLGFCPRSTPRLWFQGKFQGTLQIFNGNVQWSWENEHDETRLNTKPYLHSTLHVRQAILNAMSSVFEQGFDDLQLTRWIPGLLNTKYFLGQTTWYEHTCTSCSAFSILWMTFCKELTIFFSFLES